ncbi:MAG: Coenzyme F420 hydrogenase/dehydrogenase, beta subunit C-terminal domain, partial [Promethearchaeota archaeon]
MDAIAEYLIKSEDFSKILATLLKEKVVDKIIGAQLRVDKKTGNIDRFTVQPKLVEKEEDLSDFPLFPLIAFGYARTDSASKFLHKSVAGAINEKVGLIARPCDTRALIELAKIRQVNLDNLFIIGIEDRGLLPKAGREMRSIKDVDSTKIVKEKVGDNGLIVKLDDGSTKELKLSVAENCLRCYRKIPVVADLTVSDLGIPIDSEEIILKVYSEKGNAILEKSGIGKNSLSTDIKNTHTKKYNDIIEKAKEKRVKDLEEWDKLSQEEKIAELLKCTMCNTCIRGCPVCYCVDCILQKKRKDKTIDKVTYQLTRIAHDADRCVECG